MKRLAIYNPAAGRPAANYPLLGQLRALDGATLKIVTTGAPGDATRIARESAGYRELIVMGGDGTLGEVINGMDRERQVLAIVPSGHGNCLARDLGLGEFRAAFDALARGRERAVDLMRVRIQRADGSERERLAASTLAVGYVAEVVRTGRSGLAWLGRHAYTVAAVATRPRWLELDASEPRGASRRNLTTLVVNNTAHLANFRTFHRARLDDGRLDVLEGDAGWWRQMLHNGAILAGSERFGPKALWQADAVRLDSRQPIPLMIDGEMLAAVTAVDVRCESAALRCRICA